MIDGRGDEWADWDESGNVIKLKTPGPCWHCGTVTDWVEINFQAHICGKVCNDAKWAEYEEAERRVYDIKPGNLAG